MFRANFNKPLATEQAIERFGCAECRSGGTCEHSCVESATCSLRCQACDARNWFHGDLPDDTSVFTCHACGAKNRFSWRPMRLELIKKDD
jgi:hypothetical protein